MLCGYSPFRSDDAKDIVADTTRGRIVFHERYWKKISQEAKDFISSLLRINPADRLAADEALRDPVSIDTWSFTVFIPDAMVVANNTFRINRP